MDKLYERVKNDLEIGLLSEPIIREKRLQQSKTSEGEDQSA